MEKRFIFAIFLITLILIIFQSKYFFPSQEKIKPEETQVNTEQLLNETAYEPPSLKGISVESALYTAVVSEKGGIRSYRLKEYETRDVGISQIEQKLNKLLQQAEYQPKAVTPSLLYSIMKLKYQLAHLKDSGGKKGEELVSFSELYYDSLPPHIELIDKNNKLIWEEKDNYRVVETELNKIQLIQDIPGVGTIKKEFFFNPDSYATDVKVVVDNTMANASQPYKLIITCGPDIGVDEGVQGFTNLGPLALIDGQIKKEQFSKDAKNKNVDKIEYGEIGWVALQDKYFTKILIPNEKIKSAYIKKNEYEEYTVGLRTEIPSLQPKEAKEFSFTVYLGPKKLEHLSQVGKDTTKIIDYGVFGNLFRIVYILNFFYRLTHNYGVAIILLTVLINLILLPLSLKSFQSMKDMRKLQPEMEKIRKEFKDDPQKMNQEVMELYRRHKINPAGGCLPMLLQLPVLFGLFMTLRSVIELRGAPFVWWIKDLSLPDALTLPFNLPFQLGASINILPIIMTGATFLQQKVSGTGGTSQAMMLFLPLFMLFIFYNFSSGLVLYFLCSNLINVLEQLWVNRLGAKTA